MSTLIFAEHGYTLPLWLNYMLLSILYQSSVKMVQSLMKYLFELWFYALEDFILNKKFTSQLHASHIPNGAAVYKLLIHLMLRKIYCHTASFVTGVIFCSVCIRSMPRSCVLEARSGN